MKQVIIAGIIGGLLLTSGLIKADQVIFSQYDGVNTWNNVYVEIDDAKAFADANPGVAFAKPTAHIETQAVEEVKAQDGKWVTRSVEGVAHNVEQAMLPRAIVSVPTGVDIDLFIKEMMGK